MMTILVQLPIAAVLIVAVVFAIEGWSKHPQVSRLVLAFVALEFVLLALAVFTVFLPAMLIERGYTAADLGPVFVIIGFMRSLLNALALGLVVAAAFGWRKAAARN